MTPSWSKRGSKRWRYYVSQAILRGDKANAGSVARVSAPEIESRVIEAIVGPLDQGLTQQRRSITGAAIVPRDDDSAEARSLTWRRQMMPSDVADLQAIAMRIRSRIEARHD